MKIVFKFNYIVDYGGGVMYIAANEKNEAIEICKKQTPPNRDGKWDTENIEKMKFSVDGNSRVLDIFTMTE